MELMAAIDELGARSLDGLDDASLHALVLELEREGQRFEALKAGALAVWDARQVWASDGSKAPGTRLARDAHRSPLTAHRQPRGRR